MTELYQILAYILGYMGIFTATFYVISLITYYKKQQPAKESDKWNVSIIIPAYNEEESIARTIKSALSLDYPKDKLEIIVVDDGSSDNTFKIAKKFETNKSPVIKVFTRKNGGKGSALNTGIKKSNGEIIITMDADTFAHPDSLKKMLGYFDSPAVMCVAPSMIIHKSGSILQRVQQVEYYLGVFLRKSFASINAIHVTPGAFSAYRKSFFEKHGYFQEKNLTEDLEMALRIQSKDLVIENSPEAVVETIAPSSFKSLFYQRRRWYAGLTRNLWDYRELFSPKKGAMGVVVLPVAVISVFMGVFLTMYALIKSAARLKNDFLSLEAINFKFADYFEINKFAFEKFFFTLFSNSLFILTLLFIVLLVGYVAFANKKMKRKETLFVSLIFFLFLYSLLFTFWWIISFIYLALNKEVVWRGTKK